MLKWLRKYNTYILVVGGVLLMIAFLLPQTIQELGRRRLSGPALRVNGSSVSMEEMGKSALEYQALRLLMNRAGFDALATLGGGENADHWYLLTREAERNGFVGGVENGRESVRYLARQVVDVLAQGAQQNTDELANSFAQQMELLVPRAAGETRMTTDGVYKALAKFRGVLRMRESYILSPRFSDRRMISEARDVGDTAEMQFVYLTSDLFVDKAAPAPDEAAISSAYERLKNVRPKDNDLGIGYLQPQRVKLAWLTISKEEIAKAVVPDALEVQKRFLKAYPTGTPPEGQTAEGARSKFEIAVKDEQVEKAVKAAEQAVRGEFERVTRKLNPDGEYKQIPADWIAPDLTKIAQSVATRVLELTGAKIAPPAVETRSDRWIQSSQIVSLPGIGASILQRGAQRTPFDQLAFRVREIAGSNEFVLQVGVPSLEPTVDQKGDRFFFVVLDARKESAPDSLSEVRDVVARDIQRASAYEKLRARIDEFRTLGATSGMEALTKPENIGSDPLTPLLPSRARVDAARIAPAPPEVDSPEIRKAVLAVTRTLDPTVDAEKADPKATTFAIPVPKGMAVLVGRVTMVTPMTIERMRMLQSLISQTLSRREIIVEGAGDPFSLKTLEKRLKVEYPDGRDEKRAKDAKVAQGA